MHTEHHSETAAKPEQSCRVYLHPTALQGASCRASIEAIEAATGRTTIADGHRIRLIPGARG